MISNDHIAGYALALFQIALEDDCLHAFKDECLDIIEALEAVPSYLDLTSSYTMTADQRAAFIKKGLGRKASELMQNFLMVAAQRGRARAIPAILYKTISLINETLGINEGVVYTPDKLTWQEVSALARRVAKELGLKKLFLVNKIDKQLIIGFRAEVKGDVIEDSAQSRLASMRAELLKRET